jgi:hypothetical protein
VGFGPVSFVPSAAPLEIPPTLARFRSALKFTLWTWAAYWPGGGLLLLVGGLDPISIAVTASSLLVFIALILGGAFNGEVPSSSWKEFLMERPIYLLAILATFIVVASVLPSAEGLGLSLFAGAYLAGMTVAIVRLVAHVRATGENPMKSRADQAFLVLGFTVVFAFLVFWDALIPLLGGSESSTPAPIVALGSWIQLLYPVTLMVATRPLREPLSWGRLLRRPVVAKRPKPVRGY